jgi:hypothetical protein
MARRKKIGAIDTTTLLLLGAGAVVLYMVMKPAAPVYTAPAYIPAYSGSAIPAGNTTAAVITAGAGAASSLSSIIGDWFGS